MTGPRMEAAATTFGVKPRSVPLLDRAFDLLFRQPFTLLSAALPLAAVQAATASYQPENGGELLRTGLPLILAAGLAYAFAAYAATRAAAAPLHGASTTTGAVWIGALRALPELVFVLLLDVIATLALMLLFVIPGVVFSVSSMLWVNALAMGRGHGWGAIRVSRTVTRGRWWSTLGTIVLLYLPALLLQMFFEYLPHAWWTSTVQAILLTPLYALLVAGQAFLYLDLEDRAGPIGQGTQRRESPAVADAPNAQTMDPARGTTTAPRLALAAPAHETFEPDAFSAFEHRGWQRAATAFHAAFGKLTSHSAAPLLDAAQVGRGTRLLDVAGGPGYVAGLAETRGAIVTGSDFAPEMLQMARAFHPGVEFRIADAEALPFPDRSFDAVTMSFALGHLAHPERALSEARRVLQEGGRIALAWWMPFDRAVGFGIVFEAVRAFGHMDVGMPEGPPFDLYSDAESLAHQLENAGFTGVQVQSVELTWRVGSADELFESYYNGSVRTAGLLRGQSPDELLMIRAGIARSLERWRDGEGYALPMPFWIASGVRGS